MPRDGTPHGGAEGPDAPERAGLLVPAARRSPGVWRQRRLAPVALAALIVTAVAVVACRLARAHHRTRSSFVSSAAGEATSLVEESGEPAPLLSERPEIIARERLEKMSTGELIRLAKKLEGEVAEIDDDMDLSVEEDPCKVRREKARRLKAARLRRP